MYSEGVGKELLNKIASIVNHHAGLGRWYEILIHLYL